MTAADFAAWLWRWMAQKRGRTLGAEESRVRGHLFATLAHAAAGYGNLMLSPEQQAAFVAEAPEIILPVAGGWGRSGATHIQLASAGERTLEGGLRAAWKLRCEKNARPSRRKV